MDRRQHDRFSQESHRGPGVNPSSHQSLRLSYSLHPRPVTYGDIGVGLLSSRDLDDPPPPSIIHTHYGQHCNPRAPTNTGEDVLAPLPVLNKPKNQQSKQRFQSSPSTSHHVNAPTLDNSDGFRTRDSMLVSSIPIQTPARKVSLFGRVFPSSNTNSSHSTVTRDFDIPYPSLEERSRVRNTAALMSPTGVYHQFGVACKGVESQTQLGSYQMPNGPTQAVHFPPLEPAHETSKSSWSDSWHRREAAFLHLPFPSTPANFSDTSSGSHNSVY